MEVVLNRCFGGFSLSTAAVERCIQLGLTATVYSEGGQLEDKEAAFILNPSYEESDSKGSFHCKYYGRDDYKKSFRYNPIVVQVVRELGELANGSCAELKIVEIPFENENGWDINDYDGSESIQESHRSWR
tara:strand:- start:5737 stop:6129 length:393 start_codon:yes stop_codon:yes gene_type:complete